MSKKALQGMLETIIDYYWIKEQDWYKDFMKEIDNHKQVGKRSDE